MLRTVTRTLGVAALVVATTAPAAYASYGDETRPATDTVLFESAELQSLAGLLQELGYRAESRRSETGRGYINSSSSGTQFVIVLYDCADGSDDEACEDLQFGAWFGTSYEGTVQDANDWNRRKRHAKAVFDSDDGTVGLQMDLTLKGGVTREYLEQYMRLWERYLATFRQYLANAH